MPKQRQKVNPQQQGRCHLFFVNWTKFGCDRFTAFLAVAVNTIVTVVVVFAIVWPGPYSRNNYSQDFLMYDRDPGGSLVVLDIRCCVNTTEAKMESRKMGVKLTQVWGAKLKVSLWLSPRRIVCRCWLLLLYIYTHSCKCGRLDRVGTPIESSHVATGPLKRKLLFQLRSARKQL